MTTLIETPAEIAPLLVADLAEVARRGRVQACCSCSDQMHLAAQNGCRRGHLATGCAPLLVTLRPEQLLKAVVGARQVGNDVAVEQVRPVAAGDLAEVLHSCGKAAGLVPVARHGRDQTIEATPHHGGGLPSGVAEDVRGLMHPAISTLDVRPEGGGVCQAAADQLAQSRERRRGAPFSATRSKLSATACRRSLSFRPEAASGGRPSSVMALRTAAQ